MGRSGGGRGGNGAGGGPHLDVHALPPDRCGRWGVREKNERMRKGGVWGVGEMGELENRGEKEREKKRGWIKQASGWDGGCMCVPGWDQHTHSAPRRPKSHDDEEEWGGGGNGKNKVKKTGCGVVVGGCCEGGEEEGELMGAAARQQPPWKRVWGVVG